MNKFNEKLLVIYNFSKNNKLLIFVCLLAFALLLVLLFSSQETAKQNLDALKYTNAGDYLPLYESSEFILYKDGDGYHVFVSDINKSNKELIRNTLQISDDIDFDLVYPNAFQNGQVIQDNEELLEMPPIDIDNPDAN